MLKHFGPTLGAKLKITQGMNKVATCNVFGVVVIDVIVSIIYSL